MRRRSNRRRKSKPQLRVPEKLASVRLPRIRVNWTAVLLPPLIVAALIAAAPALERLLDRPVARLVIEGRFQRVKPIEIEAALVPQLDEGFLALDLDELRRHVQAISWVDTATLRRAWPATLVVHVTEHQAAARWGDDGLLNVRGELFAERPEHAFPELPMLAGPDGSERQVATRYLALRERLAAAHLALESLSMDDRGAWELVLASGQEIRLGRRDLDERLDRFFGVVAPALANELHRVRYVDLRYTNGFAVGWLEAPQTELASHEERSGHG